MIIQIKKYKILIVCLEERLHLSHRLVFCIKETRCRRKCGAYTVTDLMGHNRFYGGNPIVRQCLQSCLDRKCVYALAH